MNWHSNDLMSIVSTLKSDLTMGLSTSQISDKLGTYGENKLQTKPKKTLAQRFAEQFKDVMVIILIIAAIISFIVAFSDHENGDFLEPIIILAIIVLNATLGVIQESKAENALEALQNMSSPTTKVLRDGRLSVISSERLVPGDIIKLEAGDLIPADCRIFECASFKVDESTLTGESLPVEKSVNSEVLPHAPLSERTNMIYSGCSISNGRCSALVVSTGMDTEIGKIARLLDSEENTLTPLQIKLAKLGKQLGILAFIICLIIFVIGIYSGMDIMNIFITSVSLAVAAIPEGLPAIVTIVLALGVQKMVKKNAIVRKLPAVETLGSANVICSDKTGTLTQNKMTVTHIWSGEETENTEKEISAKSKALLELAILCCDGTVEEKDGKEIQIGDPTETSIVYAGLHHGINPQELKNSIPRFNEIPFDSDRKLMTTIHEINGKYMIIVKGAFDILAKRCISGDIKKATAINEEMSQMALRVIAVACKEVNSLPSILVPSIIEDELNLCGLIGMIDPPRAEAKEAVDLCKKAGIRPVMITGDHVVTASAIAKQLGILNEGEKAITGLDLAKISEDELIDKVKEYSVYARVTPEDKIRIVKAWQENENVVAMSGDGVNDAPALKAADIGCAMGITGTDVAKGAADIVLTDDNFATIVQAVKEGRCIYDNIKKAVKFLLSCNMGEILTVLMAMIFWHETPLLAIQLLWINLVTDGMPALALGMEPVEKDIMEKPPKSKNENIFSGSMIPNILIHGIGFSLITLLSFYLGKTIIGTAAAGRTMAFLVLSFSQLFHAFNVRSSHSLFEIGLKSNKYMLYAFGASAMLILVLLLVPPLATAFGLVKLNTTLYLYALALSLVPILASEIQKLTVKLYHKIKKSK